MAFPRVALTILGIAFAGAASAQAGLDYRSVATPSTIFYNGPSAQARKLAVASRYYPVEVLIVSGGWLKVRDSSGDLAWVESKNLSPKRMVMTTAATSQLRQKPESGARPLAQVERGVVLEFVESASGWIKVRHRDGLVGYLPINEVWGG